MKSLATIVQGMANEAAMLIDRLNARYAVDPFDRVELDEVRRLAATCAHGCEIVTPGPVPHVRRFDGSKSRLVACALGAPTNL